MEKNLVKKNLRELEYERYKVEEERIAKMIKKKQFDDDTEEVMPTVENPNKESPLGEFVHWILIIDADSIKFDKSDALERILFKRTAKPLNNRSSSLPNLIGTVATCFLS